MGDCAAVRVAVVGHVEWIEFARVERMPAAGEIVHAQEVWEEPGGGGAVAAGQLAKLAGGAAFYTALGDDELARRSRAELTALGIEVEATQRPEPQRRGFVHVDGDGERTITVIGERLGSARRRSVALGRSCDGVDAIYFTAGRRGRRPAPRGRRACWSSSARGLETLAEAGVELDALLASANDLGERYEPGDLDPEPRYVVRTAGARGGSWEGRDGSSGSWQATPLPGPVEDAYGCGDSFAAGLTYGLGAGMAIDAAAAARRPLRRRLPHRPRTVRRPADERRRAAAAVSASTRAGAPCRRALREAPLVVGDAAVVGLDRLARPRPRRRCRPRGGRPRGRRRGRPRRRRRSGRRCGSRRPAGARDRASRPAAGSWSISMCRSPAMWPASCS